MQNISLAFHDIGDRILVIFIYKRLLYHRHRDLLSAVWYSIH